MRLNDRLKRLEEAKDAHGNGGVLMIPDNDKSGESPETIRLRWEYFQRNGRLHDGSSNGVVIVPREDPQHEKGETRINRLIQVVYDPNWYGNEAHALAGIEDSRPRIAHWIGYDASDRPVAANVNSDLGENWDNCPVADPPETFEDFLRLRDQISAQKTDLPAADNSGLEQSAELSRSEV